jgi:hypothetical protein
LVGVRHTRQGDDLGLPAARREFLAKQRRSGLLDEDLGLEVETGRVAEIFVGRARITIGTAMFTASVGIQAGVEGDVRTLVEDDRASGGVGEELGSEAGLGIRFSIGHDLRLVELGSLRTVRRIEIGVDLATFEAARWIRPRPAPFASGSKLGRFELA